MDDNTLLALARRGDADAFVALCERHRRRVWRAAHSVTRRQADAEDLSQETFIKAWRSLPGYRGDCPFSAWLARIAASVAHDHVKSAWSRKVLFWQSERPDESDPTQPTPDEAVEQFERKRRVRAAVATLGEKERTPIWLIYFEEFSLAEVSRLEGVPESTIRSRVKVGLKRLADHLGDLETASIPLSPAERGLSTEGTHG
jgi:RNA polymerase sigma-70 factor (ECF subfamily)